MTRRHFVSLAAAVVSTGEQAPVVIPVHRVVDANAPSSAENRQRFWWKIWPETVRDFNRAGVQLQTTDATGEIRHTAGDRPIFIGLERGAINLVLTDHIPPLWDNAHALAGMSVLMGGYAVCLIALRFAHGHQIPFFSTNVCLHEMLHVIFQDIYIQKPKWYVEHDHELRNDSYATRLWLFHDGAAIHRAAQSFAGRLRASAFSA
jgi:hypothetical protein